MKPEIKKLLILNAPYLLFVYLFDKAGAALRLSPGADMGAKILHLGEGFTAAFASAAPSFHPTDLLMPNCTTQGTGGVARSAARSLRQAPTTSNTARTAAEVSPADRQPSA